MEREKRKTSPPKTFCKGAVATNHVINEFYIPVATYLDVVDDCYTVVLLLPQIRNVFNEYSDTLKPQFCMLQSVPFNFNPVARAL